MTRIGCVVKVGGSLFKLPDLAIRLRKWLAAAALPAPAILIAGCGPLADTIRAWHERFHFSEQRSHDMCLELLDVSATALHALLPNVPLFDQLNDLTAAPLCIVRPRRWLVECEPMAAGQALPATWQATTDSIAARVADVFQAQELILLKSALPKESNSPRGHQLWEWTDIVDNHFPSAAGSIPSIRIVNLRDDLFPSVKLGCCGDL
jgi:5-(aminomethyl)-3-furanmethanol phosphate kinase